MKKKNLEVEKVELDNLDIKVLRENFDGDTINKIDMDNVSKIIMYLKKMKFIILKICFYCFWICFYFQLMNLLLNLKS